MSYLATESFQSLQREPDTTANINLIILRTPRAELRDLCNVEEEFPHVKRGPRLEMKTDTCLLSINCGLLRVMCGSLTGHFSFRQLSGGAPFTFTFVPLLRKLPSEVPVTVAEGSGAAAAKQVQHGVVTAFIRGRLGKWMCCYGMWAWAAGSLSNWVINQIYDKKTIKQHH